ncbi:hypothetical protein [Rathayibacter soli]|uniref:hypothetical protein n=1 Tax=Rathayibacter soli TaxID=3144168 RepID=UPI0027E4B629|nr:hypothetical protein [Glaciibacter superstes]
MNVIALIVSFVFFLGGLFLMYLAATLTAFQAETFIAGILCVALSFGLPIHWLHKFD